jgi:GAF domain-containing protein/DNA-binding response OmpR family regulator
MKFKKMPRRDKKFFKREGSGGSNWRYALAGLVIGAVCLNLAAQTSELHLAVNVLPVIIIFLIIRFFPAARYPVACPQPVASSADWQKSRQPSLNDNVWASVKSGAEVSKKADEKKRLPMTNKKPANSSKKDMPAPPRKKQNANDPLAVVNQLGQALTSSLHLLDVASICQTVLGSPHLKELFQFDTAEICLWDEEISTLTATLQLPDESVVIQRDQIYQLNQGFAGWIAAQQQTLLIDDAHTNTQLFPKAGLDQFPYHAYLGVPLKVGLKLLGTMELAAKSPGVYTPQDVTLLEIVANTVAIAFDHARLFDETQHKVSELSLLFETSRELSSTLSYNELLQSLSRQMMMAFPADDCAIFDVDEATGVLSLAHRGSDSTPRQHGVAQGLKESFARMLTNLPAWESAFKSRLPFILHTAGGTTTAIESDLFAQCDSQALFAVPLVSRDKITGLLVLFALDPQAFTDDQIPLAQSLANQASIALDNARLFGLTDQRLQRRIDELSGLQRVSDELNSTLDLDKILDMVLAEAMRVTKADLGHVDLYDAHTRQLVAHKEQIGTGQPSSGNAAAKNIAVAGQKIMTQTLDTGEAIIIADVRHSEDFAGFGPDTRSRVVVPIFYGSEPAGVINLESAHPGFFTESQMRYLESLANQAAVAIGNAQAYDTQRLEREQASRRIDQLSRLAEISNIFRTNRPLQEVLEDIAFAISESVGYQIVLISQVVNNPPELRHVVGAGIGIPISEFEGFLKSAKSQPLEKLPAVLQQATRLSKSYFIPVDHINIWRGQFELGYAAVGATPGETEPQAHGRMWQTGDVLLIPLVDTEDNILGLLTVEAPDSGERPTVSTVETLEIFANHAATAIENARLFDLEQQRRRLADTLRGVAETISSQLEFDELLNVVLRELSNVIEYDNAAVLRLEEDKLVVIGGHTRGYSQQVVGLTYSMLEVNPHRLVIETQEPIIIGDAQKEYPGTFSRPPYDRVRGWLGVPLTYGANILGVMALGSTEVDFFAREDSDVALAFANQVAVAMQNARLFDDARNQVRQLAALTEVAQALNRALDLNEVLNLVLDAVFDLVGLSQGSIWLVDELTHTVKIANTHNISDFMVEVFNESAISVDDEPFAAVIRTGEVLVITSSRAKQDAIATADVPFQALPDDVTYVPLKTEQGVIGILAIETVIHNPNMLQLVNTLADLAAIAIDNTRLLEYTRQRANEMQNLYNLGVEVSGMLDVRQVMRSVVDNAAILTQTEFGVILFWDEETERYLFEGCAVNDNLLARLGFGEESQKQSKTEIKIANRDRLQLWHNFTQQITDSGHPLHADAQGQVPSTSIPTIEADESALVELKLLSVRVILGVPIRVQNQIQGALFVGTTQPRSFNNHDIQVMSFVANQAAVAVRNAQLVQRLNLFTEELEQRVTQRTEELAQTLDDLTVERDRVEALYQITRELSASLDVDRILSQALSLINRAVGISQGSILLLHQDSNDLTFRASLGRDVPLPKGLKAKEEIDYLLAERVVETQEFYIITDLAEIDWLPVWESLDRRSAIAVPLVTGEDVAGALLLFHPEPSYFTEDHLKLVAAAASQVATAINNAELYRLITDQADRLGVMLRTQATEAAKNEAILRGITDGVLVLDPHRNIVLVNPKAAEILEIEAAGVENQPLRQMLGQPTSPAGLELTRRIHDNLLAALERIETGDPAADFRVDVEDKAVVVSMAPVTLGAEESPSIVTVLRDISREAEIERMKNEFISTVSHELRTPLTSIKGYADLLVSPTAAARLGELSPMQRGFIEKVQSNANRLDHLVKDILEISRIETDRIKLELEPVDMIELINEVSVSFGGQSAQKPMNFSLDLPNSLPPVWADRSRVVQVLVNLVGNAWRYTPENGDIIVRAALRTDGLVQVEVQDSGIGIPEKDQAYIFDRFYRAEDQVEVEMVDGTGLGLAITKSFVEMMGGKIWVESKLNAGSIFSFTVPVMNLAQGIATDTRIPTTESSILLIGDHPGVIRILKSELAGGLITSKGSDALAVARSAGQMLKLIVLDVLLKDTSGFDLLHALNADETLADIPVLVGALCVNSSEEQLALRVVDYLSATAADDEVLKLVRTILSMVKAPDDASDDRVLVVHDDAAVVERLKTVVGDMCGCHVERAFNSQQALDMVVSRPDLILANPHMPGIDSRSVISELRRAEETQNTPIVAVIDPLLLPKTGAITMLGISSQPELWPSFSAQALVAESRQIGHNIERKVEA